MHIRSSVRTRAPWLAAVTLGVILAIPGMGACKARDYNDGKAKAIRGDASRTGAGDGVYMAIPRNFPAATLIVGCYDEPATVSSGSVGNSRSTGLKPPGERLYLDDFQSDALPLIPKADLVKSSSAKGSDGLLYKGRCQVLWGAPTSARSIKNKEKDYADDGGSDAKKLEKLRLQLAGNTVGNADFMLKMFTSLGLASASHHMLHDPVLAAMSFAGVGFGVVKFAIDWKIAGIRREEESEKTLKAEEKANKRLFLNHMSDVAKAVEADFKKARKAAEGTQGTQGMQSTVDAIAKAFDAQDKEAAQAWAEDLAAIAAGEEALKSLKDKDEKLKKEKKVAAPIDGTDEASRSLVSDETLQAVEADTGDMIEERIGAAQAAHARRFAMAFNAHTEEARFSRGAGGINVPFLNKRSDAFFSMLRNLEAVEKEEMKTDIKTFESERKKKKSK